MEKDILNIESVFKMRLVYKFNIGKNEELSRLCKISNNLYNQALYIFRETLSKEDKWLSYYELNNILIFNKTLSRLISIKDLQRIRKTTNRIKKLYYDRDRYLEDVFHKISRRIVDILIDSRVTKLIVGYNKGWKTGVNMGKKNNQKFTQIPFARLISYLEYKCRLSGIEFVVNEESYTSKCDALALEPISKHDSYLGKRIKRGLFQSSVGKLINADVNGALNIMRKVVGDSNGVIQRIIDSGLLFNPVRVRSVFPRECLLLN